MRYQSWASLAITFVVPCSLLAQGSAQANPQAIRLGNLSRVMVTKPDCSTKLEDIRADAASLALGSPEGAAGTINDLNRKIREYNFGCKSSTGTGAAQASIWGGLKSGWGAVKDWAWKSRESICRGAAATAAASVVVDGVLSGNPEAAAAAGKIYNDTYTACKG